MTFHFEKKYVNKGQQCSICGTHEPLQSEEHRDVGKVSWWRLNDYFGLNGVVCLDCFDLVRHDAFCNPTKPKEYERILIMQKLTKE